MIPQELYNDILVNIPIVCVDGILLKNGYFLMLKRNNEPEKNKWWFPGGRILKDELSEAAILRKFKEEINIDAKVEKFLGFTQTIFTTGPNNIPVHTINLTYVLSSTNTHIVLNSEHQDFRWFNSPSNEFHPELNRIIKLLK